LAKIATAARLTLSMAKEAIKMDKPQAQRQILSYLLACSSYARAQRQILSYLLALVTYVSY
jgi:hypothetical protein